MTDFSHNSSALGRVHGERNDQKHFCYFTGFLEGITASGDLEVGEIAPLLQQCIDFVKLNSEPDAADIIEDFSAELLDYETVSQIEEVRSEHIDSTCEKSSTNRFLGYCAGIACDDLITLSEATRLLQIVDTSSHILADPFVRSLRFCLLDALEGGEIDPEESAEICLSISKLVGDCYADTGVSSYGVVPDFSELMVQVDWEDCGGLNFMLTGQFRITPRSELENELEAMGLVKAKSVSKKLDFIIVASEASRDWIHTHKGTKIVRALELREQTGRPFFVSENEMFKGIRRRS
jgi:hypothetical protein